MDIKDHLNFKALLKAESNKILLSGCREMHMKVACWAKMLEDTLFDEMHCFQFVKIVRTYNSVRQGWDRTGGGGKTRIEGWRMTRDLRRYQTSEKGTLWWFCGDLPCFGKKQVDKRSLLCFFSKVSGSCSDLKEWIFLMCNSIFM